jgi:hypothetical protein
MSMTVEENRNAIREYCKKSGITEEQLEANYPYLFGKTPDEAKDSITHPSHYAGEKYECIEVMREVFGDEAVNSFCLCNAFKYLWRCNKKHDDATTDLKKARYYIDHLINHLGGA